MLVRVVILSVFLAFSCSAHADSIQDHTIQGTLRGFHNVDGRSVIKRSFRSDDEARAQLTRILSTVGLNTIDDRIILRASADTADAVAAYDRENDTRFIFYNASFMQKLNQSFGDDWSLLFILAHEVGHHLAFHGEVNGRFHEFELEADRFAGFILRRMGATLDQAEAAISLLASEQASVTHPGQADRLQAITLGWTDADREYLRPEENPAGDQAAVQAGRAAGSPIQVVDLSPFLAITTGTTDLRTEPGRYFSSLGRLETGTPLTIIGEVKAQYWYLARDKSGTTGYVRKDQVRRLN